MANHQFIDSQVPPKIKSGGAGWGAAPPDPFSNPSPTAGAKPKPPPRIRYPTSTPPARSDHTLHQYENLIRKILSGLTLDRRLIDRRNWNDPFGSKSDRLWVHTK